VLAARPAAAAGYDQMSTDGRIYLGDHSTPVVICHRRWKSESPIIRRWVANGTTTVLAWAAAYPHSSVCYMGACVATMFVTIELGSKLNSELKTPKTLIYGIIVAFLMPYLAACKRNQWCLSLNTDNMLRTIFKPY
jgi:hypothetical protein